MSAAQAGQQELPTEPGLGDWRALARSAPWRWTRLTVVLTGRTAEGASRLGLGDEPAVRLRLVRGASDARAETLDGRVLQEGGDPGGARWANRQDGRAELTGAAFGWTAAELPRRREAERRDRARVYELDHPARRPDGLVLTRGLLTVPDPPFWQNYFVCALLDPRELADGAEPDERHLNPTARPTGVRLLDPVRVHERDGRLTWSAGLVPTEDYEPRCGCCALASTYPLMIEEYGEDGAAAMGWSSLDDGPERVDVSLDVATGIVTSLRISGGPEDGMHVTVQIEHAE